MTGKALDQMERIDKRRLRAMSLTSQIMQIVGKHVPYDRERDILRDIGGVYIYDIPPMSRMAQAGTCRDVLVSLILET